MAINLQKSLKNNSMSKFNQTINVEIQVDTIANQLREKISPEFKHREELVEAIIGTALNNKDTEALQYIYNAMTGHIPKLDFKVGDIINCKATTWMYVTEESRLKKDSHSAELGKCVIVNVNAFSNTPYYVEYDYYCSDGSVRKDRTWVKAHQCSKFEGFYMEEDIFN